MNQLEASRRMVASPLRPVLTNTPPDCDYCIHCGEFVHMPEMHNVHQCSDCFREWKEQKRREEQSQ